MKPNLDAIRARCEAAAPAPWVRDELEIRSYGDAATNRRGMTIYDEGGHGEQEAEFIAHARTDIPALLAYIDELEEERDDWREAQEATQAKSDFWRSQFRATYTIGETEWAHRIAVAEQRFVDAERELAELKARITTLEAMKP